MTLANWERGEEPKPYPEVPYRDFRDFRLGVALRIQSLWDKAVSRGSGWVLGGSSRLVSG